MKKNNSTTSKTKFTLSLSKGRASLLCALLLLVLSFNTHKTYTMGPEIGWVAFAGAAIVGGYAAYKQFLSYIHEEPIEPFNFSGLPEDVQQTIIALLAQKSSAKSLKEAAQIINSLARANHSLNKLINQPKFCLEIIKSLAQQFKAADSEASRLLQTKEARRRNDIQEQFRLLFCSEDFTKQKFDDLYKKYPDVDLNFTYDTPSIKSSDAEYRDTLFFSGFSNNEKIDAIKLQCLLDSNADINCFSRGVISALNLEISFGTPKIVTMLCQSPKIKLNEQNIYGETALSYGLGIYKNNYASPYFIKNIQILLDAGADPELADNNGLTPLQAAQEMGNQAIINIIQDAIHAKHDQSPQQTLFKLCNAPITPETLIKFEFLCKAKNVDLNFIYPNERTLLMIAAILNKCPIIHILLNHGADINQANFNGQTALMLATYHENIDIVQCLISNPHIKKNLQDRRGNTALQIAIHKKNKLIIKLLLDAGANPKLADNDGLTALQAAQETDDQEIIDLIQDAIDMDLIQKAIDKKHAQEKGIQ